MAITLRRSCRKARPRLLRRGLAKDERVIIDENFTWDKVRNGIRSTADSFLPRTDTSNSLTR